MPLPSFLQRFRRDGQASAAADLNAPPPMDLEVARTRARRRLIGMLVLVVAGVLGFPWLFETQPRPLSQDVQIVQAPSAGGAALPEATSSRALSGRVGIVGINPPVAQLGQEATAGGDGGSPGRDLGARDPEAPQGADVDQAAPATANKVGQTVANEAPVARAVVPSPKPVVAKPAAAKPEPAKASAQADKKPAAKPTDKPVDKKLADKKPADKKPADKAKSNQRYVVQFGAFADNASAQTARFKAERAGLKTYAQTVDTPAGKRTRVRVGPYADKAEAEKAQATLRKAGLAGAILTL
jgi:DedD protein